MTIYMGQCGTVQQIPSCIIEENVVNMYIASSLWRPELGKAHRNNGIGYSQGRVIFHQKKYELKTLDFT